MPKVTFILGLCASGKTYIAEKIKESHPNTHILDEGLNPNPPYDVLFKKNYAEIISQLQNGNNCVVIEMLYCVHDAREFIETKLKGDIPEVEIEWKCIENDLLKANKNVLMRALRGIKTDISGHLNINSGISPHYTYPENVTPLDMYEMENHLK